mmetsp:Transcript_9676/g.37669  ORF Transcript_9676/g.37669 Transcript_9676/m.37669 type:complete len:84 (-) Transcript_9676:253-504(-)
MDVPELPSAAPTRLSDFTWPNISAIRQTDAGRPGDDCAHHCRSRRDADGEVEIQRLRQSQPPAHALVRHRRPSSVTASSAYIR